jgi:calcium-translocating P-type ATPase
MSSFTPLELNVESSNTASSLAPSTPPATSPATVGLTSQDAADRLALDGPNRIPTSRSTPLWREFVNQLVQFFSLMLWVAGLLSFFAGMPQLGIAIFVVILINATFAFSQEFRAERASESLRDLLPRLTVVIRNGERQGIDVGDVVTGDVVVLRSGDRICADLQVIDAEGMSINASMITGESATVAASSGAELYAGCFVTQGEGTAIVQATGAATRLASIAKLTRSNRRPRSPLELELNHVVRVIAVIAVGVGVTFFFVSLLVGGSTRNGFLFAVGVTVALVPEGLLPTVTLSLAAGAQQMAKRHALVRRLEAVETLGSTTFICSDKTGTITQNQMTVVEVWTSVGSATVHGLGYDPDGVIDVSDAARSSVVNVARIAARCSEDRAVKRDGKWMPNGDPMEAAIFALARRCAIDLDEDERSEPLLREWPFDPNRRMMSVLIGDQIVVKGAPESVFPRCHSLNGADEVAESMTRRGLRVIAVASRRVGKSTPESIVQEVESGLELRGLLGIEDPPRPGIREAIAACRGAGIRIAMLTGDNSQTAAAIARDVGLIAEGGLVLSGAELPADEAVLGALIDRNDGVVISRVTPEDKLRVALALQRRGHVVAMTGDGVNDGPALQAADIGVAMGLSGTDVAREAADLVLLDDDFTTIVSAVQHGRVTFANMRRFLTYHLVCNVAELTPFVLWAVSGGQFPLALGVLQILCFDIGADVLPALALGVERASSTASLRPLTGRHLIDRRLLSRVFLVLGPTEAIMEILAFVVVLMSFGWTPSHPITNTTGLLSASGTAFATVILSQVAVAFACRSATQWPGRLGWFSNRLLIVGVALALALLACFVFISPVAKFLNQAAPPPVGWLMALVAVPVLLSVDALHKLARRHNIVHSGEHHHQIGFRVIHFQRSDMNRAIGERFNHFVSVSLAACHVRPHRAMDRPIPMP